MNNADKVPQIPVMLDNFVHKSVHTLEGSLNTALSQTLMRNPLALLDRLWPSAQRHEVAFDYVLGIVRVQPERQRPWEVICVEDLLAASHHATLSVHANSLGQRRRLGQRWKIGGETC